MNISCPVLLRNSLEDERIFLYSFALRNLEFFSKHILEVVRGKKKRFCFSWVLYRDTCIYFSFVINPWKQVFNCDVYFIAMFSTLWKVYTSSFPLWKMVLYMLYQLSCLLIPRAWALNYLEDFSPSSTWTRGGLWQPAGRWLLESLASGNCELDGIRLVTCGLSSP